MPTNFTLWSSGFLQLLVDAALRTLLLAAVTGTGLAVFRVKSTSLRLFTWTGVLFAGLAMPLLAWLVPALPIPLPSIVTPESAVIARASTSSPRPPTELSAPPVRVSVRSTAGAATTFAEYSRESRPAIAQTGTGESTFEVLTWFSSNKASLAAGFYLAIALLMASRLYVGILLARRLASSAHEIHDPRLVRSLASHRHIAIHAPLILESDVVAVPVTVGAARPAILLPTNWRTWDDSKLDAVIAHELSHVARRDALTQTISRLHRAIFWFSPLTWWLDRQIHLLAEQASDEAALSGGVDRTQYAKALLGFFESLQAAPGRVWWQGVSMAKPGQAEHRLERILTWRGAVQMSVKRSVLVAMVALAVPAVYLAAAARPASHPIHMQNSESTQVPAPPAVPRVPPATGAVPAVAPVAPVAPIHGVVATGVVAPAVPGTPAIPAAPAIWSGQGHGLGSARGGFSYSYGFDDEQRFVIVSGKSDSFTMSGSSEDAHHVQRLKKQIPGDFIWFERDEKSYIIRDQATIDRARKLWAPQEELGRKQEELGKQQEALGKQQEELGAKMEQVRVNVPDMTAQMDKLKAELKQLGPTATMEQLGNLQSEIGELQSKIGEVQSHAGEAQGKLGAEQGELGEKQGKLGELQGEFGRQQGELAEKATKQMKSLLDEAIKNGTAKPETDSNDGGGTI